MQSISKNQIKLLSALKTAKFRKQHALFCAEGEKLVLDLIDSGLIPQHIVAYDDFFENHPTLTKRFHRICSSCSEKDMGRISNLKSPSPIYATFKIWENEYDYTTVDSELVLVLDQIKDPGNMGTIIRTADWFGIKHVVCINQCVETFNPKLVQSTMGSIARVKVYHLPTDEFLTNLNPETPLYGTLLEGENIYQKALCQQGYIITGNESKGISQELIDRINHPIHIPAANPDGQHAESLNASIATAIVCAEFYRQSTK